MKSKTPTPTTTQFQGFQNAYAYFNQVLFHYELPSVILNLSRKSKAMGFVAPNRWVKAPTVTSSNVEKSIDVSTLSKGSTEKPMHELSINPEILLLSPIDVYSTLVHEQCHVWQFHSGKPSHNGYHNKEWARKMMEVGLMPSSTGKEGGNITGQQMSDYPIQNGVFLKALKAMPPTYKLPFVSIEAKHKYAQLSNDSNNPSETTSPTPPKPKNKVKYSCPECNTNIWAKPNINVICGDCELTFICTL